MGIITIAFDDGYRETFESCAEFLTRKGIRATFAVPVSFIGQELENRPVMDTSQIDHLIKNNHEIASHTSTHRNLLDVFNTGGEEAVKAEMKSSREMLEKTFGIKIESMVFPFIEANHDPYLRHLASGYYNSSRITTEKTAFNRLPVTDPFSAIGVAFTRDVPIKEYEKLVDIANEFDLWLIEVFHLVSEKNTKSAHRDDPYRFFTHIEDFKRHVDYILSKGTKVHPQKNVIKHL
ncbi:MAG: polysaccharide deacetylase family protein [Candidatus Omnitrophota bacterium]